MQPEVLDAVQSQYTQGKMLPGVLDAVQTTEYLWQGAEGMLDAVQSQEIPRARCSLGYLMQCRLRNT